MSSQIVERVSREKTDFSNPVIRWLDYRLPHVHVAASALFAGANNVSLGGLT
jgi:hypothetical protein